MNRAIAFAMLLVLPAFGRADMALLPQRHPPVSITITVDREHPDYAFFTVEREKVERVEITPSNPLVLTSENRDGHIFGVLLLAVPKADLKDGELPAREWLERPENRKYFVGSLHERGRVDFTDNRDRIEKTYLLRVLPDGCRLDLVSENRGSRWAEWGWAGLCCMLPTIAIIWLGFWLVRKVIRRTKS